MAVTENSYTGNGSQTNFPFTFPYLKSTDVQVQVDAAVTTAWSFANATTVQFNTAPTSGAKIKILRDTNVDSLAATFYAGSSIKSEDLNDNYTQNLYKTQEVGARYFSNTGGTMTGDLTLAQNVDLIFEGTSDDANETKLVAADPTADRTITLPNVSGTVVTTGDTGSVSTNMIAGDAITNGLIANDQIDSEHYVDGSIDTQHIADSQITTAKIADNQVTTAKIVDANITGAKLAADSVNGTKIADDSINSEHYVDGSIDTQHIADNQITTAKLVDNNVTADKLAHTSVTAGTYSAADITVDAQGRLTAASSGAIATSEITDAAVTTAKINNNAVTSDKLATGAVLNSNLATNAVNSANILDLAVNTAKINNDAVTSAKIADNAVGNEHLQDDSVRTAEIQNNAVTTAKIVDDAITNAKIAANAVDSNEIGSGVIDTVHIGSAQVTDAKLASNAVTTAKITDANVTTAKIANDAITIGKIGCEQTTISDSDSHIPTSGAVVDYVAAQIAPLGGLEVIATEVAFPNTQPSSGVVISISDAGGVVVNGSGVSTTGRTVGGSTVTINGFPASLQSKTMAAGIGLMVSSTGSSQTYNYHKILAKEADVEQLSNDINDFAARYRVASSAPSSSLDNGDLWFDTVNGKMMVYNGTNTAWEEVSAIGSFNINTISSSGSTGGGSATFNGSAYRFTLSNPPQDAQQLLVSINGVIQKPNSGTSQPSEGFAVSGNDIIFSSAPASGSDYFIITQGQSVQIGTPSDGSVSTAKLVNDAVTQAKIAAGAVGSTELAANAVITSKIADDAVTAAKLASGAADLLLDTSPQLGGDLDSNNFDIHISDNKNLEFGDATNADLYIKHSVGHNANFIVSYNGDIEHHMTSSKKIIKGFQNSGTPYVSLYYDNVLKFQTESYGARIFNPDGECRLEIQGSENNGAYLQLRADDGDDNADYSRIFHSTNGSVYYQNFASGAWETNIKTNPNGSVELYHDGFKNLEVIEDGLYLDNDAVQNTIYLASQGTTRGYIFAGAGNEVGFRTASNEWGVQVDDGAEVALYYGGNKKIETTGTGASVTGGLAVNPTTAVTGSYYHYKYGANGSVVGDRSLTVTGSEAAMEVIATDSGDHAGSLIIRGNNDGYGFINSSDNNRLEIVSFAAANGDWNVHGSGHNVSRKDYCIVANQDAGVELYHDNSKKIETTNTGVTITGHHKKADTTTPAWSLRPNGNSNETLGSSTALVGWTASSASGNHGKNNFLLGGCTLSGPGSGTQLFSGNSTGRLNVPVKGIYQVTTTVRMENNPEAQNIYLYINGSAIERMHVEMWNHRPYMHGRISGTYLLEANDYIEVRLHCNGGTVSGTNDTVNWFKGHLVQAIT